MSLLPRPPTLLLLSLAAATAQKLPASLGPKLQKIIDATSDKYQCTLALAIQTGSDSLEVHHGNATNNSRFVWGSVTKQFTGATLAEASAAGKIDLDASVAPLLDPMLKRIGVGSMAQLWGEQASLVTARHLATMRSGVPDYDTASPDQSQGMKDPFRAEVYRTPATEYTPASLLNQSWVATGALHFKPGTEDRYSSTNFVLIGLLLAQLSGAATWDAFDQSSLLSRLPASRRKLYEGTRFAVHGAPSSFQAVQGFDRTSYNGADPSRRPGTPVWNVSGVYAGWTAADVTAPVSDIARFSYDLYGKAAPQLLSPAAKALMAPVMNASSQHGYGFATFRLGHWTGQSSASPAYVAYGHLGATYGYDSIEIYFPAIDLSLAIASNIETDNQAQPSEAVCLSYAVILAALTNTTEQKCTYDSTSYFGGCDCGNNYSCGLFTKQCRVDTHRGSLSKEDCEQSCGH